MRLGKGVKCKMLFEICSNPDHKISFVRLFLFEAMIIIHIFLEGLVKLTFDPLHQWLGIEFLAL